MMKQTLLFILLFCTSLFTYSQVDTFKLQEQNLSVASKAQHMCLWGDSKRMELHTNQKIYVFKEGLEDGLYTAYFDKKYQDTAMVVVMEGGKLNGLLRRWDSMDNKLAEEVYYINGKMDGVRKMYFFSPEGDKYVNAELWEKGKYIKTLQTEW